MSSSASVEAWSASYAQTCSDVLSGPTAAASKYATQVGSFLWERIPGEYRGTIVGLGSQCKVHAAEVGKAVWHYFILLMAAAGHALHAVEVALAPVLLNFKQQLQLVWWWLSSKVWPRFAKHVFDFAKWLYPQLIKLRADASAAAISIAHNGPTQVVELYEKSSARTDAFLAANVPAVHAKLAALNAAATPYVKHAQAMVSPYINTAANNIKSFYILDGQLCADRIIYTAAVAIFLLTAVAFFRSRVAMQDATSSYEAKMDKLLQPPSQQGKPKKSKKSKKSKKAGATSAAPDVAPAPAAAAKGGSSAAPPKAPKKKINMAQLMKKAKATQKEADKLPEHDSLLRGVKGHSKGNSFMTCFAMSPDQRFLATGGTDSKVRVTVLAGWEESAVSKTHSWELEYTFPTALAWSPNSHQLLVTDAKKQLHVYSLHKDVYKAPTLRKTHTVAQKADVALLQAGALSGNSASLFAVTASTSTKDTGFHVISMASGEQLASADSGQVQHYDVVVSPSAEWLSIASWTHEAKLWHVDNKGGAVTGLNKALVLGGHHGGVRGVHFSSDSKRVHTVGMDGEVRQWSLDVAWRRGADARKEGSVAVPRPGKVLRSAMRADGSLMAVLMQEGASAVVKPDTASAAGGGANGRLIFLDPRSGEELPLSGGDMDLLQCFGGAGVHQFAFSPCGQLLLTLGKNAHRLLIWRVPEVGDSDSD